MSDLSRLFDATPARGLADAFDSAAAAGNLEPVPAGEYLACWQSARLDESRRGTPCFVARFEIVDGDHAGRVLRHAWYLSAAALPYSKRDLAALGLNSFAALESGAVPPGRVRLRVAVRRADDGAMFNEIRAVCPVTNEAKAATSPTPPPAADPVHASGGADPNDIPGDLLDPDLF